MESRRFSRSKDVFICGVCAGLAEYIGMNVTLMRVLWVLFAVLSYMGLAVVAYVVLAFVMAPPAGAPDADRFWHNLRGRNIMMVAALVLICLGAGIIAQELLHIDFRKYFLPVGLIAGGVLLMIFAFSNNRKNP